MTLEQVKAKYPNAVKFHWHQNAFNKQDAYWMVAIPVKTLTGKNGLSWIEAK